MALTIFHLETAESRPADSPPLTDELLVHSDDGLATLQSARQQWFAQFPPETPLLMRLLLLLISADFFYRCAHQRLQHLEFDLTLAAASSDINHWDPYARALHHQRQRDLTLATRNFQQAQRALRAAHLEHRTRTTATTQKSQSESQPEPEPPPPPVQWRQFIRLTIAEDGSLRSAADPPASFFLTNREHVKAEVWRDFHFTSGTVHPDYAGFLTDPDGTTHPDCDFISVLYDRDEFFYLCQLEVDTNSPHILDRGRHLEIERETIGPPEPQED